TAPFVSVPVTAKRVSVERGWAKTRSPGPAVTLLSACGPDTLNRIAPSAPALGVASETVSTPATGPEPPSPQLPAPPSASPIGSVMLRFFVTVSPAQPWNARTTLVSVAVRVTGVPSATNVSLGTEPEIVPPLVAV